MSLKVTFSSIYQTSSTSLTPDLDGARSGQKNFLLNTKKPEDLNLCASQADWSTRDGRTLSGSGDRPVSGSGKQKTFKVNMVLNNVCLDNFEKSV